MGKDSQEPCSLFQKSRKVEKRYLLSPSFTEVEYSCISFVIVSKIDRYSFYTDFTFPPVLCFCLLQFLKQEICHPGWPLIREPPASGSCETGVIDVIPPRPAKTSFVNTLK